MGKSRFGAETDRLINEAFLGLGDTTTRHINNILLNNDGYIEDPEHPIMNLLGIMRNPDYFQLTCKWLLNLDILPFQALILKELWIRKFPMLIACRGFSKSFLLAVYAIIRSLFLDNSKIIMVGAGMRQSKIIFDYMDQIYRDSTILQNIIGDGIRQGPKRDVDRCTFHIGNSECIAIPIGNGEKIRGLRGNCIIADEFSSTPREIFEVVIRGFGAVSHKPIERVKTLYNIEYFKQHGMNLAAEEESESLGKGNQTIVAGTAYYSFNHFYDYYKKYKTIIESRGQVEKLLDVFDGDIPENFDWRDYSVTRIPYFLLPKGFMDEAQIAQAKALIHSTLFGMEYLATFATDSNGFFKRSLIESCVTKTPISLPSGPVQFEGRIRGNSNGKYVIGIDPASEHDNFAIVVLEVHPDHKRVVYTWTVNRKKMKARLKDMNQDVDKSFYNYCARKIRDLMNVFPTEHIGIDGQGGGIAIMEALHEKNELKPGELPIWSYIKKGPSDVFFWEQDNKSDDAQHGLHIMHVVQFRNQEFTIFANHGLRKDMEDRTLLFPAFDAMSVSLAYEEDQRLGREYDTLEDCVSEIEELKNELTLINHTQSAGGSDRWDTPEVAVPGAQVKKSRLRKDRYTALCIANAVARLLSIPQPPQNHSVTGGYVGQQFKNRDGRMYTGPEHIVSKMNGSYGRGVFR